MSAYSTEVLADSPVRYYHLSETTGNFLDVIGVFHMVPNTTQVIVSSLLPLDPDAACSLNPGGAFFSAASSTKVSQQPMTIEFWVKPGSLTGSAGGVSYVASCGAPGGWACGYLDTTGQWYFVSHSVIALTYTAAAVVGTTYHVVFVVGASGDSVDLYVNGAFKQTQTPASAMGATTQPLQVGGDAGTAYATAVVDEFAVYTTALSAARILAHYSAGSGESAGQAGVNFLHRGRGPVFA